MLSRRLNSDTVCLESSVRLLCESFCDLSFLMHYMIVFGSPYCSCQKYSCFAWVFLSHIYSWSQHSRFLLKWLRKWKLKLAWQWATVTLWLPSRNHLVCVCVSVCVRKRGQGIFFSEHFSQSLVPVQVRFSVLNTRAKSIVSRRFGPLKWLTVRTNQWCAASFNALWNKARLSVGRSYDSFGL